MGKHYNEEQKIIETAQQLPASHARAVLHKWASGGYNIRLKMDRVLIRAAQQVLGKSASLTVRREARKYKPEPFLARRVPGSVFTGKRR